MAEAAIAMNFYISFSGIITFRNAAALREVVKRVPLDRLLVETDAPWLAPVPYRGKQNLPGHVVEVAQMVADIKGISYQEVAETTTDNFAALFLGGQSFSARNSPVVPL
jgi:TatD DNase family protein